MKVAVIGAAGRMGAEVCRAVSGAEDMSLVAAVDPQAAGGSLADVAGIDTDLTIDGELDAIARAGARVAVDFTRPSVVAANVRWLLDHGVHAVVGTTGLDAEAVAELRQHADAGDANALIAPNFAIGAVLMMQFAATAARHLPQAEIIELHHDNKADAPSGTALRTAELMDAERAERPEPIGGDDAHPGARGHTVRGTPIHSVRLPGLVAHQEVILGGQGQTLTIRHDSSDRTSFMPGVLLAIRSIASLRSSTGNSLVVGLEEIL